MGADGLHVTRRGQGSPALVLLHAFASSGAEWAAVIDDLEPDHLCVVPDLRGFGASGSASMGNDTVATQADDVLEVVASQVDGPWVIVGHSMGGKIALAVAARRPPGLIGLALLAPSPPTPEPIADDDRAKRLRQHGNAAAARATLDETRVGAVSDEAAARFVSDSLACSPEVWTWWLARGSREDVSDLVDQIAVPMLVVMGEGDPVIPRDTLDASLLSRRPEATLTLVARTGHQLPLEQPMACAAALRSFMAGCAS